MAGIEQKRSGFRERLQEQKDAITKDFKHRIHINKVTLFYNLVKSINYLKLNNFPHDKKNHLIQFIEDQNYYYVDSNFVNGIKGKKQQRLEYRSNSFFTYAGPKKIEVFQYLDQVDFDPQITIKIHYPTESLHNAFKKYFKDNYFPVNVSDVEITFDFFPEKYQDFRRLINQYLFKKYNRSKPQRVGKTIYLQERPKTVGIKTYNKHNLDGLADVQPFRLETTLRRAKINKLNIEFDNLYEKIKEIDFQSYFLFKRFNREKYISIMVERYRRRLKKKRDLNYPAEKKLDLYQGTVEGHLDSLFLEKENLTVAELYVKLKEKQPINIFFDDYNELNEQFFPIINGGSFLL